MDQRLLKLEVGDFFHVEVVEIATSEKEDCHTASVKLEVKDGVMKNHYLYFDLRLNPDLEKRNY